MASPAYQQILAVFTTTGNPLRAKNICHTLGTGTAAKNIEGLRAKLKRLVARGILTEPEAAYLLSPGPRPAALTQPQSHNGHRLPDRRLTPWQV